MKDGREVPHDPLFLKNKYTKWYFAIIAKAVRREPLPKGAYYIHPGRSDPVCSLGSGLGCHRLLDGQLEPTRSRRARSAAAGGRQEGLTNAPARMGSVSV
jgi:hypothetical protein